MGPIHMPWWSPLGAKHCQKRHQGPSGEHLFGNRVVLVVLKTVVDF